MKKENQKAKQSLLIHNEIRKASFVPINEQHTQRFKYFSNLFGDVDIKSKLQTLKRFINKIIQKPKLWIQNVEWKQLTKDASIWVIEAFVEGITANFATSKLFGVEFSFGNILAHGILIKQSLDIYWRLRKNGSNTKLPKENK